ncbi:MAG: 4-(cytidine 5'-diphospho)-2-C-methyl-D-erythritol kinase [Acetobacteraceae bacterium]
MPEEKAPAKVNLFLHVTGRRPNGFHTLDSLVVFADVGDRLTGTCAPELRLVVDGPFASDISAGSDNLVLRAAQALAQAAEVASGASLRLTKNLPHSAGLGGGSADAAAALRLLRRIWKLPNGETENLRLAAGLGADVPACVMSQPARMSGIGDVLHVAPALPAFGLCLVNPGVALPTKAVFEAWTGTFSKPAIIPPTWADAASLAACLSEFRNDLEVPAITLCPTIRSVLGALGAEHGCLLARMSGSGATCFGLFPDTISAERAALRILRPDWWCWGGGPAALTC